MQRTASAERLIEIPGYQIIRRLNQSQFAATYLAKHLESSRKLVLKVFAAPPVRQGDFNSRFLQSCQALGQLRHPNIIQLYEGGIHRGVCYLTLEYVSGATRIDELPLENLRLGLQQVGDLARALHCAHSKGFVHGCIEAARVFVERERRVMLGGFEQQLLVSSPTPSVSRYLSPERKQGAAPQVSSDVYGLGMLLYCLLVRRPPTEADFAAGAEHRTVDPGVPALPGNLLSLQPLINRALAPSPNGRFSSAAVLADAIDAVTEEDIEAVYIATPHYLASIQVTPPPAEVPTLYESEADPLIAPSSPEVKQAPAPPQRRVSGYLPAGVLCILVAGALMVFRERGPLVPELFSWVETHAQNAASWWQEEAREPGLYTGADIDPVVPEAREEAAEWMLQEEGAIASSLEELEVSELAIVASSSLEQEEEPTPLETEEWVGETAPAPAAETHASIDANVHVEEGDRLLAADALTVPSGANALEAYQHALALDPRNARAWTGLQRIVQRYVQLTEARIADHDMKAAAEFVRRGLAVDPHSRDLLALQAQLTGQSGISATTEDREKLSAMARIQMVRENYVTPAGDSAYDHYSRLLLIEPDNQEARSGLARIERELAGEIELRVNRNRFDQAQALLVRARDAFPTSQRFHNLNLALEAAVQAEQQQRRASAQRD